LPPAAPDTLRSCRVMVVDDNADAAWSIGKLLQIADCEVRIAEGGEAALALVKTWWPDVLVLDIGLPDMSGHAVARQLREMTGGENLLLIAATGWGQQSDRQAAAEAGFDAHLVKPVDLQELRGLIQAYRQRDAR